MVKKEQKKNRNAPFLTKKERKKLLNTINNVNWSDEDSVWDVGIALNSWSIKIRSEVLRRSELRELGEDI